MVCGSIAKVRDLFGLYLDPPAKALVLRVDEKTQSFALDRFAAVLPMTPGMTERGPMITRAMALHRCLLPWT